MTRRAPATNDDSMQQQPPPIRPPVAGQLLRVFWLVLGNAIIYASWVAILLTSAPLPCMLDAVVGITVALMLVARWVDITRFGGRDPHGQPATRSDWRRYLAILVGSAALGEFVAHFLGGSLYP